MELHLPIIKWENLNKPLNPYYKSKLNKNKFLAARISII